LATAYNLEQYAEDITIYDISKPGIGGASAVSAGLMHPFAPRGNLIWQGLEGFAATMKIIDELEASGPLESSRIFNPTIELVRLIDTENDFKNWQRAARKYPDWLTFTPIPSSEVNNTARVVIKMAGIVDCPRYVEAFWKMIDTSHQSVHWRAEAVEDPVKLCQQYDVVILCCGASIPQLFSRSTPNNQPCNQMLDVKLVRGQNIVFRTKSHNAPDIKEAVICGDYIVPKTFNSHLNEFGLQSNGEQYLLGGATHEYLDSYDVQRDDRPDLAVASQLLLPQLNKLQPLLADQYQAVAANAGVRVVTPRTHFGKVASL